MFSGITDFFNNLGQQAHDVGQQVYDAIKSNIEPIWNQPTTNNSSQNNPQNVPINDSSNNNPQNVPIDDPLDDSSVPVDNSSALPPPGAAGSLWQELHFLQIEAMNNAEKKVRTSYNGLKEVREKNQTMTSLLQHITSNSDENGAYEIKDDAGKKLLTEAHRAGLPVDKNKIAFTKDERDALVRNIELQSRNLETDIKIKVNEVQEGLQVRNTFYQELKTMWDKIVEAVRKVLQGISVR